MIRTLVKIIDIDRIRQNSIIYLMYGLEDVYILYA